MIGYVPDDGGRKAAGYSGKAGDCVARALAIVLDARDEYRALYRELADGEAAIGKPRSARNGVSKKVYPKVFARHGLAKVKLPSGGRPTYSEAYERYGDCIVSTARHVAAITGGALRDTFDGRTYEWRDEGTRERKAMSVWVKA